MSVPLYDTLGTEAIAYIIDQGKPQQQHNSNTLTCRRFFWWRTTTYSICLHLFGCCFCSVHLDYSVWRDRKSQPGTGLCQGQGTLCENHRSNGVPQCRTGQQGATGWNPHSQPAGYGGRPQAFVLTSVFLLFLNQFFDFFLFLCLVLSTFCVVCLTSFAFFSFLHVILSFLFAYFSLTFFCVCIVFCFILLLCLSSFDTLICLYFLLIYCFVVM